MLKRLHVRNFTVFEDAEFEFSPGLNVVVGTNGTGKSHVLKLGYAVLFNINHETGRQEQYKAFVADRYGASAVKNFDFVTLEINLERKMERIFSNPSEALARKNTPRKNAVLAYDLMNSNGEKIFNSSLAFVEDKIEHPHLSDSSAVKVMAELQHLRLPVFIPAKEILTLGWVLPASEQLKLPIDETYLDLLRQLRGLPLRQPEPTVAAAINYLTAIIGGEVEEESGRYYLASEKQSRMEMNMVAEGLRKFGTLQKLLSNGSLTPRATLFWDEPEANLNPALLRQLAELLVQLAAQGFQIILATHSLFLLKEFHILSRKTPEAKVRYFGLSAEASGATRVTAENNLELLPDIVALDAELEQSDRFQEVLDQEDADHN